MEIVDYEPITIVGKGIKIEDIDFENEEVFDINFDEIIELMSVIDYEIYELAKINNQLDKLNGAETYLLSTEDVVFYGIDANSGLFIDPYWDMVLVKGGIYIKKDMDGLDVNEKIDIIEGLDEYIRKENFEIDIFDRPVIHKFCIKSIDLDGNGDIFNKDKNNYIVSIPVI